MDFLGILIIIDKNVPKNPGFVFIHNQRQYGKMRSMNPNGVGITGHSYQGVTTVYMKPKDLIEVLKMATKEQRTEIKRLLDNAD